MSAIASALAAVRRSDPAPDLPASKRWIAATDPESALLTLAAARDGDAIYGDQRTLANAAIIGDYAIDAYSLGGVR
jgi:hypothetical protein